MVDQSVTFRAPASLLFPVPVFLATLGVLLELIDAPQPRPFRAAGFALTCLALLVLLMVVRARVRLDPSGVWIRTLLHRRLIRWSDISAVTLEPAGRTQRVTVWLSHRPVRLPVPSANKFSDQAAFLRDYHRFGQYWQSMQRPGLPPG